MLTIILAFGIQYVAQTAILTLALWIMIKLQSLDWNFLGLLGSAALASALDMIPYFGHYLAVPVLYVCITKVTHADLFPDSVFTVVIAYAVMFLINMLLLTAVVGDLRPSVARLRDREPGMGGMAQEDNLDIEIDASPPEESPGKTGRNVAVSNVPKPAAAPLVTAQPAALPAAAGVLTGEIARNFAVKGVTTSTTKPMAIISTGVRSYTMFLGDAFPMDTPKGKVTVRCAQIETNQVVLEIEGEKVIVPLQK